MKYSFLFPYHNRVEQFWNTVISLQHWYGSRDDWEAIVVIDGAQKIEVPGEDPRVKMHVIEREGVNPAPLFNLAAQIGSGEFLVISNPECYHATDVLGWFDKVFSGDPGSYAVAACDAVKHIGRISRFRPILGAKVGIFQHSTQHNVLYHYCSAMHRTTWERLGGFDERFGDGYACEDDDFRDRVVCSGIRCHTNDAIRVLHQEHVKYPHTPDIKARYQHNLALLRAGEAARGYKHDVNRYKVGR